MTKDCSLPVPWTSARIAQRRTETMPARIGRLFFSRDRVLPRHSSSMVARKPVHLPGSSSRWLPWTMQRTVCRFSRPFRGPCDGVL